MTHYRFDENGNELPPIPKSISAINEYVKLLIEEEALLQDVYAIGEISNFKNHYATGHFYLTLKDEKSEIKAIMFRSYAQKLKFKPQDGMKVIIHGRIGVYPQAGSYQLYIDSMQPDGIGSLYLAFEQLKASLEREGLFNAEHKKQIPKYPTAIGVITSSTGAAIRDIIKVATKRYPFVKIVLFPALVQGSDAPCELIKGMEFFNIMNSVDVIIIGRGGGSAEDLWAFNDENLARSIYNSKIPVISAVGHEIDFTICDFVADVRAATPSHAAELATPDINEIRDTVKHLSERANYTVLDLIESYKSRIENLSDSKALTKPLASLDIPKLKLANAIDKLISNFQNTVNAKRHNFIDLNSKLVSLNPLAVISRGYGAIFDDKNNVIKSAYDVEINSKITVKLNDGKIIATVDKVERSGKSNG